MVSFLWLALRMRTKICAAHLIVCIIYSKIQFSHNYQFTKSSNKIPSITPTSERRLTSIRSPDYDHNEDTDDDATISIYSESCIDLTEDSDEDMAPVDLLEDIKDTTPNNENKDLNAEDKQDDVKAPRKNEMYNDEQTPMDLSEYIDAATLNTVKHNVNKELEAKAKRDGAKTPTKNATRLKKNEVSKRIYHSKKKQTIAKMNRRKQIKQMKVRAELDKNPLEKQKFLDKRNKQSKERRASERFARMHNAVYPSKLDRLAETQCEKDGMLMMGKTCKNSSYVPERVRMLHSGIPFFKDPLGSITGEGFYQGITSGSMSKLYHAMLKLMPIEKVRFLSTLDMGSGLSLPSLYFSQYIAEFGVHFGIESQAGLVNSARTNIKNVTAKGLMNISQGNLSPSNIKKNGELKYVRPPSCLSIQGDIMHIVDLAIFDLVYGFDDVNHPDIFHHMAKVWNNPKSKMCKMYVTNATPGDLEECGFEDIVLMDSVRCQLARLNKHSESRVFYVYLRKTLSTRTKKKWIFENDNQVATASGPFKEAWEKYNNGRLSANSKYSFNTEIVKMNMEYQDQNGWMDNVQRSNRTPNASTYNEDELADFHWNEARRIAEGGCGDEV